MREVTNNRRSFDRMDDWLTEDVESRLSPEAARVFTREIDTDWKYVDVLYQAFKQRLMIELGLHEPPEVG